MNYTVHEILQARIPKRVTFPFSRGSSQPRDRTQVSHIAGRFFTTWLTMWAQYFWPWVLASPHMAGTYSVLRWQIHCVCVEVLEKGTVHGVGELVYFYHLLHVLIPVRLEHGSKVLAPETEQRNLPTHIDGSRDRQVLQVCLLYLSSAFIPRTRTKIYSTCKGFYIHLLRTLPFIF